MHYTGELEAIGIANCNLWNELNEAFGRVNPFFEKTEENNVLLSTNEKKLEHILKYYVLSPASFSVCMQKNIIEKTFTTEAENACRSALATNQEFTDQIAQSTEIENKALDIFRPLFEKQLDRIYGYQNSASAAQEEQEITQSIITRLWQE